MCFAMSGIVEAPFHDQDPIGQNVGYQNLDQVGTEFD